MGAAAPLHASSSREAVPRAGIGKEKRTFGFIRLFKNMQGGMLADSSLLKNIFYFEIQKDMINDETIEFMRVFRVVTRCWGSFLRRVRGRSDRVCDIVACHASMASSRDVVVPRESTSGRRRRRQPYLDIEEYNTLVAKNASKAAEGLCAWTKAMCSYQAASKIVKPKLEALKSPRPNSPKPKELDKAEAKLQGVMDVLNKLKAVRGPDGRQGRDRGTVAASRRLLTPSTRLASIRRGHGRLDA